MIKLEDLDQEIIDLIEYTWRIDSEDGNPPTPIEELVEQYSQSLIAAIEFANPCNLPESGRFGPKGACGSTGSLPQRGGRYKDVAPAKRGGDTYGTAEHEAVINAKQGDSNSAKGSSEEQAAAHALASRKITDAPVPTKERVKRARLEVQAAQRGTSRPGGEGRGGSSYDRRNSRVNLFDEFGGFSRGYVVDPETGLKMHWADPRPQIPDGNGVLRENPDHIFNPEGYPPFERSRIFTHAQGGGYQQPNLISESFSSNRARAFRPVRPENQQTNRKLGLDIKKPARFSISEQARFALKRSLVTQFYNKCHSPEDGKFCETEGGGSVSATISDVPRYFQFTIKDSLDLISQVHGVRSDMPKIPVVEVPRGKTTNGYFQFGMDNSPTEIGLSADGPHPHFTFIHEYGHFLDNSGHLLHPNSWNSDRTGDPPMEAFHKAVKKSQAYGELETASREGDSSEKGHASYLLNKRETFARAYTQWIAKKTGNELLREGLDIQRNDTDLDRFSQWSDEEFEPISAALDVIFQHTISASAAVGPCCRPQGGGTGCGDPNCPNEFSSGVKKYLKEQYHMDTETAKKLGLSQSGTKLLIPFRDETGKITSYKWRDTAVKEGPGRWGPSESLGLSLYENDSKSGPLFVVESPSEGLILAAKGHRVVFFDGADSLVSRTGVIEKTIHSRLIKIVEGNHSILIPDNDVRGEAFAQTVEPLVTQRINPPAPHKDLRDYLINGDGDLDQFINTVVASAIEFHLGAQHDQSTHGRRGGVTTQADMAPSSALSALPRPKVVRAAVNSALASIDKVHNVPDGLTQIPIKTNSKLKSQATYSYRNITENGNWVGDLPVMIEINPTKSQHTELSMTHEYGHYMDSQVFGSNIGKDPDLQKAFQASKAMKQLLGYANNKEMGMQSRKRAAYYLQPHETFARAYAQWVGLRSGNKTMQDQVLGVLTFNHEGRALPVYSASQWSEKDFAPIATALDNLFQGRGLLK